ncbi:MAG: hypothetical protein MUE54_10795 [Anaerolineae bacterium]|nr:hypothetical protein [Anaerolineae bacterium]
MSDEQPIEGEMIVINFREAYARKEKKAGRRISKKVAAKQVGMSYFSFTSLMRGDYRTVNLDNLLKVMVWLDTNDFNDMFERRKIGDGTQAE